MYNVLPSFVLGFHGCDEDLAEAIFAGRDRLRPSQNDYDWLGHGVYFWESNPARAAQYAQLLADRPERSGKGVVKRPAVVGAVIDLGSCLNLLDSEFISVVSDGYTRLHKTFQQAGWTMPENRRVGNSHDLLLRHLDCAVIECVHQMRQDQKLAPFDSVRGVFVEGPEAYPGAGVHADSHIQLCVRNQRCIKGYFRVLTDPT